MIELNEKKGNSTFTKTISVYKMGWPEKRNYFSYENGNHVGDWSIVSGGFLCITQFKEGVDGSRNEFFDLHDLTMEIKIIGEQK